MCTYRYYIYIHTFTILGIQNFQIFFFDKIEIKPKSSKLKIIYFYIEVFSGGTLDILR